MNRSNPVFRHVALAALLATAVTAHAQRVTRDADTGALRAPTADEVKAMDAAGSRKAATPVGIVSGKVNPAAVRLPNGTVMHELTTDTLMYSVARKNADGSISQYCVHGDETAHLIVKGQPAHARMVSKVGKEQTHEVK